jgi:predicted unusual protein kinase regulating ubiquinone biosynthesis (AarF/ABC1/UbiB family)
MSTEDNRFSARAMRYARVGSNVGAVAARVATGRLLGRQLDNRADATALAAALGGLKGPLMKVAQLLSTIPEALPPEYARELSQLQSNAPPMGPAFVRRRLVAELGSDWRERFGSFAETSVASASLGQVHRATTRAGEPLAVKLQYPDMQSAVEADLNQLRVIFAMHARMGGAVDTREMLVEIGDRLREELDYQLEGRHMRLYGYIFANDGRVRVPDMHADLSTRRMLTMGWMNGRRLLDYKSAPLEDRNRLAEAMYRAWWHPVTHYAVIHGDPHLGNYTVFEDGPAAGHGAPGDGAAPLGTPVGINLLDYGCIRKFRPTFVKGVVDLYHGLLHDDRAQVVHAYETWGFKGLKNELIDALSIWARFIYGPLLDDRERTIADGTAPGEYGRGEAFKVHQILKEKGPVTIPREFVFMDRAAIGLGGVFLHLDARRNWYRLFNETIEGFDVEKIAARQAAAFEAAGIVQQEAA